MMIKAVICLMLVMLLTACSFVRERPDSNYRLADMRHLQQQKQWAFEGRLALVGEHDSITASVSWRHEPEKDEIELVGPLAQGRVAIVVTADAVVVDDGDTRQEYQGRADDVVGEQLGMDMPVDALKYWVLGVTDPEQSFVEQEGGFFQNGWLVRFAELQQVKAEWLPRKVTVEKNKTRIKLIVDQWELL